MIKDIPNIKFKPVVGDDFGFEILPIDKISERKDAKGHDSQVPHRLKFYNFIFFTEGNGRHFIDFKWHSVKENTLVYLTKEQVHAFDFSTNLNGYCMLFTETFFMNCFSNLTSNLVSRLFNPQLFSPILEIPKESDFIVYFNLLQKEFFKGNTFNQKDIIKSLFTILILKAENIEQNQGENFGDFSKLDLFQKFNLLVENHYKESRNANYYANKLAITYKHLNIICKELTGKTAKNIIDEFVILQAKRELINTSIKSTKLAYELGFEDSTNFTKYFKKHTGLTPKSFIISLRDI